MCDHCSTHWADLDLETGQPIPQRRKTGPAVQEPIPEIGCPECLAYFGWSTCRKGQYKNLGIVSWQTSMFIVWDSGGVWPDTFHVLGHFGAHSLGQFEMQKALKHLAS